jgi:hypothetical protein
MFILLSVFINWDWNKRVCCRAWNCFVGVGAGNLCIRQFLPPLSQVEMSPAGQSRSWGSWLPDVQMYYIGWRDFRWCLTSRNTYIWCRVEETCSNPASWQWGACVIVGRQFLQRWCIAGTCSIAGAFCFNFTGQRACFATSEISHNKSVLTPPMVSPPYRGGGVWVLLRPWELCRR